MIYRDTRDSVVPGQLWFRGSTTPAHLLLRDSSFNQGISCTKVCGYPGYSEVSFACGISPVLGRPSGSYRVTNH